MQSVTNNGRTHRFAPTVDVLAKLRMNKTVHQKIVVSLCLLLVSVGLRAQDANPVTRSTMYGLGGVNLYDTYLSPMEYTGVQVRVLRESSRMTPWMDGNVSRQVLFQGYMAAAENRAETASELAGMVNWNYALHYNFSLFEDRLTLLVGPMAQLHGGFVYNTRNSNNPAQARLYVNLAVSSMAQYRIPWKHCPLVLRYQVDAPCLGVMFSPQYGQSYYEIFSLGHADGTVVCTSFHNQPSLRHWLTADMTFRKFTLRAGYMADMQQARVNGLRSHDYSHTFMLGLVHKFVILK